MTSLQDVQPYISFIGTMIQLGGALLLALLFLVLRPYARRRKYFLTWSKAWVALSLAIVCVTIRYNILPTVTVPLPDETGFTVQLLYSIYQLSKIAFYALLAAGTAFYVTGSIPRWSVPAVAVFGVVYTIFSAWYAADLGQYVMLQAPLAVIATAWCAATLYSLPRSRRTLGSLAVGTVFWAMAALWAFYFAAFGISGPLMPEYPGPALFQFIVSYNTFFDVLTHVTLGYGMVVLLMEHAKREADVAHAELAVAHDELRRAALYDSVTGSMNRRAFAEGLGLEAARATFGVVMMLDTDNLKSVNDQHGHAAGDTMLRYLVEVLRSALRTSDKLYRWGGDEFLIVFPGANPVLVKRRLETILNEADSLKVGLAGTEVKLMVSIGVAKYASAEDMPLAIERADSDMYREKNRRKSRRVSQLAPAS